MRPRTQRSLAWTLLLTMGTLSTACATRSATTGTFAPAGNALPKPQRVLVMDFAVGPARVGLDQGLGARIERLSSGASAGSRVETATGVQSAISETLVSEIRKMGLAAERASPGTAPQPGDAVVQGQVERIDEGNRTRRLAIGFGAGKSEVDASAALYLTEPDRRVRLLQSYDADSNSGRKPGFGVGAAEAARGGSLVPAALSGASGAYGETTRAGVAAEGQRLAERLSYNLGTFFAREGWIAESAVPTSFVR